MGCHGQKRPLKKLNYTVNSPNNMKIKKGDKLLLCGFGVGYSMAATIIEY